MTLEAAIALVAQYGLPMVLLTAVAIFYVREKKAWDQERKDLYERVSASERARIEDAKVSHETLTKLQQPLLQAINSVTGVQETRELKRELIAAINKATTIIDTLERRDFRDTGQRQPGRPPR